VGIDGGCAHALDPLLEMPCCDRRAPNLDKEPFVVQNTNTHAIAL
jgi:hypothetical protein